MLYYLFKYLDQLDVPGAGLFQYISFRSGLAALLSLIITITFGKKLINILKKSQLKESIRDLGLKGQKEKEGTPTMGGIIIISAIIIPTLLLADLSNVYIILLIISTIWMGCIGFVDDYLKIKRKNKKGLRANFKIFGQIGLGLLVGLTIVFHDQIVVRVFSGEAFSDEKMLVSTLPFIANNEFHYEWLLPQSLNNFTWVIYIIVIIFIVIAVSNASNVTDGIDGLAAGISAIIGLSLAIFTYLSGNSIFSNYLNILFIPHSGELVIFCTAFVGACIGFLWYNSYPAQIFMGDTGSLSLGGIIAVLAFVIRKELLIPFICGVFVIQNLSVISQVIYFKYTKRKYGKGKRIFLMAPIHHHYQKRGFHEAKIVTRFWIIGILLAIFTLATLKIR